MDTTTGHIELILGPMFSGSFLLFGLSVLIVPCSSSIVGKTTELLRRVRRLSVANKRCLVIKFRGDTRYSEDLATHDRYGAVCCSSLADACGSQTAYAKPCDRLEETVDLLAQYDVIAIDEGQFYPDLVCHTEALGICLTLAGVFLRECCQHWQDRACFCLGWVRRSFLPCLNPPTELSSGRVSPASWNSFL
jgi:hypothetical protein